MSFHYHARKVRDENRSGWVRLAALRSCILRLSFIKGQSYTALLTGLNQKYGFDRYRKGHVEQPPTSEQLIAVLDAIEAERKTILKGLKAFESQRIQNKRLGNRQLSRKEKAILLQIRKGE